MSKRHNNDAPCTFLDMKSTLPWVYANSRHMTWVYLSCHHDHSQLCFTCHNYTVKNYIPHLFRSDPLFGRGSEQFLFADITYLFCLFFVNLRTAQKSLLGGFWILHQQKLTSPPPNLSVLSTYLVYWITLFSLIIWPKYTTLF